MLCIASVTCSTAAEALIAAGGALALTHPECEIAPSLATPTWQFRDAKAGAGTDADGAHAFALEAAPGATIRGRAVFSRTDAGAIDATYTFTPERDAALNALFVGTSLPASLCVGGTWTADADRSGTLPVAPGPAGVFGGKTRSLSVTTADGRQRLAFSFSEPTDVLIQDDRQWGPTFSVRIGHNGGTRTFKAGEPFVVRLTVATHETLQLVADQPVTLQAGPDWIPFETETEILPGSALDFSALGFTDAPAGKHGRVVSKGPHFEFERQPGVAQRFYGVNLCFTANFLESADADKLAERLARIGYNAVRFHHHDGGLVEGSRDGTTLHAGNVGKLDALVAACVKRGLYLTTDLYVSRSVPWRSVGVDRDGTIPMNTFKMLLPVHRGAFDNLTTFTRQWLAHVNPATGRSLAAEPALAWISLVNEGNYGNYPSELRAIPEWQVAWREWLGKKKEQQPEAYAGILDTLPSDISGRDRQGVAFLLFLADVETRFVTRMRAFLRDELGCHALLSNQNAWTYHASDQVPRSALYDYADDHFYVDHPHFLERPWSLPSRCDNRNPIRNDAMGAQGVVFTRLLDRPFTITEYNYSGPGRFRGVGGIVTGAMGALQDWSGLWRFAFSHSSEGVSGGKPVRMNYFDMAGDPLSLAAERASLCLFLRGDLAPLERSYALAIPEDAATRLRETMPRNRTSWPWLAWHARLGTLVGEGQTAASRATWTGRFPDAYDAPSADIRALLQPDPAASLPSAGDGAVSLDPASGTFVLKTSRTCGGFTEAGRVDAGSLTFDVGDVAATVWVSALDDQPIARSSRVLLTHLTDVQNTGIRYAQRSRKTLQDWGTLPHLARNGKAQIRLAVEPAGNYTVHALSTGGRRVAEIPARVEGGHLAFIAAVDAVPETATLLYEIVRVPMLPHNYINPTISTHR